MKAYIDLGMHTVPLKGDLKRLKDGSKTIPYFEEGWRDKYTAEFNTKNSPIGGLITGECSGVIAIDCDNSATWRMFSALDPYNKFVFISKGKGEDAGTLIYKYTADLPLSFSVRENGINLDFYSNQGFVYLPTKANTTKVHLAEVPEPYEVPEVIKNLLLQLHKSTTKIVTEVNTNNSNLFTANFLAPLLEQFVSNKGEYMPGLFRIITPKRFRSYEQYTRNSHLHPSYISDGDGSSYLTQVSAILGADLSVSEELYMEAMTYINDLFEDPMAQKRLETTVLNPMVEGKASIDGKQIWKYDPAWESYRSLFTTKDQSTVEIVYDDIAKVYYVVDSSRALYTTFTRDTELYNHLHAITATAKTKKELIRDIPLINTITKPNKPFGFCEGVDSTKRDFNVFKATPALNIFYNPEDYASKYKRPDTILKFINTLIPDEQMVDYLLSFLKTKLTTFNYSPVVLYFLGVPGSGKGTFVRIIENIFGLVPAPTAQEFLDKFNGWIEGAYFAELDEYGDTLSTVREKEEAVGKLKALTGKQKVDIRKMRENSYSYEHNVTFIMTANKNPLMLDEGDRRIALFNTPNVLADQNWVEEAGGIEVVFNEIMDTTNDFCYYLATEVNLLTGANYMRPPMMEGKFELIADSLPAAARIAYALKGRNVAYLEELALDYACDEVAKELLTGEIALTQLEDLYMELTQDRGTRRALIKAIREQADVTMRRGGPSGTDFIITGYMSNNPFTNQEN